MRAAPGRTWALGCSFALSLCVIGCGGEAVPPASSPPAAQSASTNPSESASTGGPGDQVKGNHNYNSYRYYGHGKDTAKGGYDAAQKKGRTPGSCGRAGTRSFSGSGPSWGAS